MTMFDHVHFRDDAIFQVIIDQHEHLPGQTNATD